jgi:type IV pilus assembly protein PilM
MFLFSKKDEILESVGLDIGSSFIKVVQLKKEKEKIFLETYGEIALGPYSGLIAGQAVRLGEEKLIEALKDLFREAKVTAKDTTVAIDPSAAYVSLVKVPKVEDDQLKTMMPIEARKYIPVPLTDVQMDWWHVPTNINIGAEERMINVVLAAVNNETLNNYDRVIRKLELKNVEYEINGYSLIRSSIPRTKGMLLYVDIGAQYTTLSLVYQSTVLDMHVISRGSQDSTIQLSKALSIPIETAEETKHTFGYLGDKSNPYIKDVMQLSSYPLFGEVARLSLMLERKYNQNIEGIILSGGGARVPGVLESYNQTVHIPGRIVTPFEQIDIPTFLSEMIAKVGPSYAVAIGCALKKLTPNQ